MRRIPAVVLTCLLGIVFLVGSFTGSATAQKGDDKKPKLPTYWKDLKLSVDQKDKVFKIQTDYTTKIDKLKKEIKKLDADEKQDLVKVLNDKQKEQLRKIYLDKFGIDTLIPPPPKVDPDPKKDPEIKKDPEKK